MQASAVANTWARRCNKIIFFTSETATDGSGKQTWVWSGNWFQWFSMVLVICSWLHGLILVGLVRCFRQTASLGSVPNGLLVFARKKICQI
jgi:hypothetical protein